jgi:hypothetical protein
MHGRIVAAIFTFLCAGCAQMVWVKPGATQDDFNRENAACEAEAYRQAPVSMYSAPQQNIYVPGNSQTHCDVNGNSADCTSQGPLVLPISPIQQPQDVNANARVAAFRSCMFSKGWNLQQANNQGSSDLRRMNGIDQSCFSSCLQGGSSESQCRRNCPD